MTACERSCGARHFIEKGGAQAAEFAAVVDALLASRFTAVVIDTDTVRAHAAAQSLEREWPEMLVFLASGGAHAERLARQVRPALALLHAACADEACLHACRAAKAAGAHAMVVAYGGALPAAAQGSVDAAVAWPGSGREALLAIVRALLAAHRERAAPAAT